MALRFHERESGIDKYPNVDPASWAPCVSDFSDPTTAGSSCSTPTTNGGVLRRGAATDLMEQVGDALAAPRSAYVHVQRSGRHTGAAGVGAGARTLLTLKWMTPKTPASRSTLSGSTPEGGAGCECGCPPHPAAHIGHTADAIPLPGNATTFPPPGGYPRRCSHAMGRARACASSSLGFPTNLLSTHLQCP